MSPKQIKRLRAKLKMTQPQFAAALGLKSREHIGRMENGDKEPNATLILLMKTMAKTTQ